MIISDCFMFILWLLIIIDDYLWLLVIIDKLFHDYWWLLIVICDYLFLLLILKDYFVIIANY